MVDYSDSMAPPPISIPLIFAGSLEIAVPLLLGYLAMRRLKVGLMPYVVGCALFTLSLIRMPINSAFQRLVYTLPHGFQLSALFMSTTAALFEEGVRLIAFLWLLDERSWSVAVVYGLGHGGMESMLLAGVNSLIMGFLLILSPSRIPFTALMMEELPAYLPLLALYERLMAIAIHLLLTLLVLRCVVERRPLYLAAALLIHFAVDLAALLLSQFGAPIVEAAITPIAALSLLYLYRTRPEAVSHA